MSTLADTIREIGAAHIGELNLLLNVMTDVPRERQIIAKAVFSFSGATDQIPQPELDIGLAISLGLVKETKSGLSVTHLGERVRESAAGNLDRFTPDQLQLLLPEILGHPDLREQITSALELFEKIPETDLYRLGNKALNGVETLGLQVLQTCQVTRYQDAYIVADSGGIDFVREILGPAWAMTDEDLWEALEAANKRGKAAEEYVVKFEKARLVAEGNPGLADLVNRVSAINTRSPYDVRSFNTDASPRFIEVKSSVTMRLVFYWTDSERRFASAKGQSYWLYYIPRSQDLPNLKAGLKLIQDPVRLLGTQLNEEPVTYRVTTEEENYVKLGTIAGIEVSTLLPRSIFGISVGSNLPTL